MKLNLFFAMMDLLILLTLPIVFVHGRLLQLVHPKAGIAAVKIPAAPVNR